MKTGKKLAGILLALCLLLSLLPMAALAAPAAPEGIWTDYAADAFAGGSGTEEDPYQIATPEQLAKLAADVNTGFQSAPEHGMHLSTAGMAILTATTRPSPGFMRMRARKNLPLVCSAISAAKRLKT